MKYVVSWTYRLNGSAAENEAAVRRWLELFGKWTPSASTNYLEFVGRLDGNGGFSLVETDNPMHLAEVTSKFGAIWDYQIYPVVEIGEAAHALQRGVEFRDSISPDWSEVNQLVAPDSAFEVMASSYGDGLYLLTHPSEDRRIQDRRLEERFEPKAGEAISVTVFVDSGDAKRDQEVLDRVDELVRALGYDEPFDVETETGSIFRRSKAQAQQILSSQQLQERLAKVERGFELAGLEVRQAQVDQGETEAVGKLLRELKDVELACVRAGSILLVKFPTNQGPVLLVRQLSQIEIHTMERFPEIQRNPPKVLDALATALAVDSFNKASPTQLEGPHSSEQ